MATPQEKIAVLNKLIQEQRNLLAAGVLDKEATTEREVFADLAVSLNSQLDAEKAKQQTVGRL